MSISRIVLGLFSISVFTPAVWAIDTQGDEGSISILENTWDKKQSLRAEADAIYSRLKRGGHANVDVAYAYLLAKIRQSDYRKAVQAADELLEIDPTHLAGNRARTWLLLLTRQPKPALSSLLTFDSVNDSRDDIDATVKLENIRAIGRMYGYLEGPAREKVADANLRKVLDEILDGATDEEQAAFQEERDLVLDTFKQLIGEKQADDVKTIEDRESQRQELLEKLEEQSTTLAEREKALLPMIDEITEEANSVIGKIQARAAPLESELRSLNSEINSVRIQYQSILDEALRWELMAQNEKDQQQRDRYLFRASQVRFSARRYDASLAALNSQANSVAAALQKVQAELSAAQAHYGGKLGAVQQALQGVAKDQKRVEGQGKRASKPVKGTSALSKALDGKAEAVTTYEEFPVELERDQLLAQLKERLKK